MVESRREEDGEREAVLAVPARTRHGVECPFGAAVFPPSGALRPFGAAVLPSSGALRPFGAAAEQAAVCWDFAHVMEVGDAVFAVKGARLMGLGVVTGGYRYEVDVRHTLRLHCAL